MRGVQDSFDWLFMSLTLFAPFSTLTRYCTGSIPIEIGDLHRLEVFHAETNNLEGSIPTEVGNLKSVKEIRLYENKLSGSVPQEVCNLKVDEELTYLGVDCANDVVSCACCTKCF